MIQGIICLLKRVKLSFFITWFNEIFNFRGWNKSDNEGNKMIVIIIFSLAFDGIMVIRLEITPSHLHKFLILFWCKAIWNKLNVFSHSWNIQLEMILTHLFLCFSWNNIYSLYLSHLLCLPPFTFFLSNVKISNWLRTFNITKKFCSLNIIKLSKGGWIGSLSISLKI